MSLKKFQNGFGAPGRAAVTPRNSASDKLVAAFRHHQEGRVWQAAQGYREVLAALPNHPEALHLSGLAEHQLGEPAKGAELIQKSLMIDANQGAAWNNLGNAMLDLGDPHSAKDAYDRVLEIDPQHVGARFNRANVYTLLEDHDQALQGYQEVLQSMPDHVDARCGLASTYFRLEQYQPASEHYQQALRLQPGKPGVATNLGPCLAKLGMLEEAAAVLEDAVRANAQDALAHSNLATVYEQMGRVGEAADHFIAAAELAPDNLEIRYGLSRGLRPVDVYKALVVAEDTVTLPGARGKDWNMLGICRTDMGDTEAGLEAFEKARTLDPEIVYDTPHLGHALASQGRLDEAVEFLEQKIARTPEDALAYAELGLAWKDIGAVPYGVELMRQGLKAKPDAAQHSNLLFTLFYSNEFTAKDILTESQAWAAAYTPDVPARPAAKPRNGRKLKIGYLSADFHAHPAGYLYEALFPLHDREKVDITLYINQVTGDEVTDRIKDSADRFRIIRTTRDEDVARMVRDDEIDVFVDLLGHTNNHRLQVFGMRPAPVQVGWLGYFGTTGMQQMDYIVCDQFTLPEAEEGNYTEKPARMPRSMYTFQPPRALGVEVGPLPMASNGYPTFGCFNNTAKITPEVVALWCEVLKAVPDARMILNRWPFKTTLVRERYAAMFEDCGVSADRIEFRFTRGRKDYFAVYNDVDVMLDTFPFGGGTTTSEALWMGVPVVTLPSDRLVGHMTESVYHAVGLADLVVGSAEGFVGLACSLVGAPEKLAAYRRDLRAQVEGSSLCDLKQFARDLEDLFARLYDESL
ncbi:MAG: tetratricopeptide repeat protein [bacterium]